MTVVAETNVASELYVLARRLDRISEQHRWSQDFTFLSLQEALREVIACFPVYRTYISPINNKIDYEARYHIVRAVNAAKLRNPARSEAIFDFILSALLSQDPPGLSEAQCAERRDFVMRFQQLTGPVMAKGLEDTACYRT